MRHLGGDAELGQRRERGLGSLASGLGLVGALPARGGQERLGLAGTDVRRLVDLLLGPAVGAGNPAGRGGPTLQGLLPRGGELGLVDRQGHEKDGLLRDRGGGHGGEVVDEDEGVVVGLDRRVGVVLDGVEVRLELGSLRGVMGRIDCVYGLPDYIEEGCELVGITTNDHGLHSNMVLVRLTINQLHGWGLVGIGGLAGVCCRHALGERVVLVVLWVGKRHAGLQGHPADSNDARHFGRFSGC